MKSVLLGLAVVAATSQLASAATILNGSFEDTSPVGVFDTLPAGNGNIANWTIDSGTVDFIGSYWQAAEGANSIDMTGGSIGTISQLISGLTNGVKYIITFAMSGNPDNGTSSKFMTVNVFAPAHTPRPVIDRLNKEVVQGLNRPEVREKFFNVGLEVVGSPPDELAAFVKSEIAKWGKVIREAGIRIE